MTKREEPGTRERLLTAACVRFADQGYRATTVQQVCNDADANIAAVNYHFGSKLELYRAAWQRAAAEQDAAYPLPEDVHEQPLEWLKSFMTQRLRSVFDTGPAGWLPDLVRRELMAPSPLHGDVVRERLRRSQEKVRQAVSAYLGPDATAHDAAHCAGMVTGSFVMFNMGKTIRERHGHGRHAPLPESLEIAIDRSLTFHIGGLQAVRRKLRARGKTGEAHA